MRRYSAGVLSIPPGTPKPIQPAPVRSSALDEQQSVGSTGKSGLGFARGPALSYERGLCVHEAFERQARKTPNAIAITCGQENWTYARLDAEANRLAVRLRREGVGPEVLVGIHLARKPELLVGILGILKAG